MYILPQLKKILSHTNLELEKRARGRKAINADRDFLQKNVKLKKCFFPGKFPTRQVKIIYGQLEVPKHYAFFLHV